MLAKKMVTAAFALSVAFSPLLGASAATAATSSFALDPEEPCYVIEVLCSVKLGYCWESEPQVDSDCDGNPD